MSSELDKHFSDTLNGYESTLDTEALWQSVKPSRKPRRRFFFLLLFGVGLAAGMYWWQFGGDGMQSTSVVSVMTANETDKEQDEVVVKETVVVEENFSTKKEIITSEIPAQNTYNQVKQANKESSETAVSQVVYTGKEPIIRQPVVANGGFNQVVEEDQVTLSEEAMTLNKHTADIQGTIKQNVEAQTQKNKEVELLIQEREPKPIEITHSLDKIKFLPVANHTNYVLKETPINEFSGKHNRNKPWFVEATTAYLLINRKFSQTDNANEGWMKERLQRERLLEATSAGLSLGYQFKNRIQVRGGIDYTRMNSEFSIKNTNTRIDSVLGVQAIIISQPNDTITVMGQVAAYSTINADKRTYNSFTQWELPVMIGYNLGNNKLSFLVEGGVRLLMKRTWEGEIFGIEENIIDLSAKDWYEDKLGLSLQAGLNLGYNIGPNLQLSTGIQLRYSLSDFTNSNAPIKENYHLFGGQLALKWRL